MTSDPMSTAATSLGHPVAVPFNEAPCHCVRRHHPHPRVNHMHHIVPLSWGGTDAPENLVALCPSSHMNLHLILDRWVRVGHPTKTTRLTPFVLDLAMQAWSARGAQLARQEIR